jgi:hypothetical protein
MLSVAFFIVMLSVVILTAVMLNVVAPKNYLFKMFSGSDVINVDFIVFVIVVTLVSML